MINQETYDKIEKIIRAKPATYTPEEALAILQQVGIIDENGEVTNDYKNIIVKI